MSTPNPLPDSNASSSKPPSKSTSKPKKPVSPTVSHVNPTLASEMSSAAAVPTTVLLNGNGNGGERQRGPVEEVIAKRMRQLGKKLQRYRTYAVQPIEKLNADQRAAIVSMPALEGAYKELEDLIREKGPVDEQELIQAAKMREASEATERTVEASVAGRVEAFQDALVHPLSRFLRLHALLHPAQSSDHDQLTFGRLTLPFALRDEVQATDVLRVGRMHEDLLAGGDAGKGVIGGLAKGSAGDDEENDHVHHLVHLFDQPESEQERQADASRGESDSNPVADPSEAGETEVEPVPEVIPPVSRTQSDRSMPNGHSEEDPAAASMALNFLQDDELEANIEDSYEVVPMLEPHETSGLQPPIEAQISAPVAGLDNSAVPSQAQTLAALSASTSPKKWAEMDDDDEPAFATTAIATTAAKVDEATVSAENGEPAIARVQENDIAAEPPLSEPIVEVPTSVDSAAPPQQAPIATQTAGRATQPANMPSRPRATSGRFQQPWPKEPAVVIDEDGFETKIRRAPQQAFRGRGGGGGDRGSGSLGRGRGGRGGGAPQGQGPRPPRKDGPPNQPQQSGQSAIQAKAKSIFKEVQPGAPTSAPVS